MQPQKSPKTIAFTHLWDSLTFVASGKTLHQNIIQRLCDGEFLARKTPDFMSPCHLVPTRLTFLYQWTRLSSPLKQGLFFMKHGVYRDWYIFTTFLHFLELLLESAYFYLRACCHHIVCIMIGLCLPCSLKNSGKMVFLKTSSDFY